MLAPGALICREKRGFVAEDILEMTPEEIIDRCGQLHDEKAAIEKQMSVLRKQIVALALAADADGAKTIRLPGRLFEAKVEKKFEIAYDKTDLKEARSVLGDETFMRFFEWEFVPKVKKTEMDAFIKMSDYGHLIEKARRVREMSPSVTFKAAGV